MLGTPPQDKLHEYLHIFNTCEHPWIIMIMVGSKMSKIEYDLTAIMYPAYDTPHKLCNIRGIKISSNPDYHPIMQADPCVSSNGYQISCSNRKAGIVCVRKVFKCFDMKKDAHSLKLYDTPRQMRNGRRQLFAYCAILDHFCFHQVVAKE